MDSPPITGDLVRPLFVVHSDRWLQPATNACCWPAILVARLTLSEEQVGTPCKTGCRTPAAVPAAAGFVAFLNRRAARGAAETGWTQPWRRDRRREHTRREVQMDGALLQNLSTDYTQDPSPKLRPGRGDAHRKPNEVDYDWATSSLTTAPTRFI
jgi:hypothetical protein